MRPSRSLVSISCARRPSLARNGMSSAWNIPSSARNRSSLARNISQYSLLAALCMCDHNSSDCFKASSPSSMVMPTVYVVSARRGCKPASGPELRGQPPSPEGRAEAAKCLNSKMNLVAAKAARIAGEWQAAELTLELVAAFDRFMVKPETTDKRCAAKIEILKALCKLEYSSPSVFRRGLQHIQMEPTWGG